MHTLRIISICFIFLLCCSLFTSTFAKVNINTASVSELDSLPGIGEKTAEAIVEYRKAHGPFKSIEDIQNVKRIGEKLFAKIKDSITVEGESSVQKKTTSKPKPVAVKEESAPPPAPPTPTPKLNLLPDEYVAVGCFNCKKTFYIHKSCSQGWCPYCGIKWQNQGEGK